MFPQLYTAASGLIAGERQIETSANNLANASTPAYQSERPLFESYLSEAVKRAWPGAQPTAPNSVFVTHSWRSTEAGPLHQTGNPLDLALESPGYFRVQTPNGERLTRAGNFTRNAEGGLMTTEGFAVLDDSGQPIQLPEGAFTVNQDGTFSGGGRLGIVNALQPQLTRDGESLWDAGGNATPVDPTLVSVRQGNLEGSNVDAVRELTGMVAAQRLFELQQRMVDLTGNQLARRALELGESK
jgi:flagellar basal body rod protein FlgG